MEKIILDGVKIQFNDFSEEMQRKLYLQKKEEYREDAAKSRYPNIRILVIEEETDSSNLNEMLRRELQGDNTIEVKEAIKENPYLKLEKETIEMLAYSKCREERVVAAKKEKDSSKLNKMFRRELKSDNKIEVKEAIMENTKFKLEEETIEALANSGNWIERRIAAEKETDSLKLNEMLQIELLFKKDSEVKKAIMENPNLKLEEKTIEMLANSECRKDRVNAANKGTNSLMLNRILRRELQGGNQEDVIIAVLKNSNLKLQEETIEELAYSKYWENRIIAAKSDETPTEILVDMYQKETDGDVLAAIEKNMEQRKELDQEIHLTFLQRQKLHKVSKEFKNSECSKEECLEKILEIIG